VNAVQPVLNFGLRRPASPALIEGSRTITYGELAERVRRTASHLSDTGLGPGDRIGLCLKDSADHVIALLAMGYLGAVAVPLDWRATPAETAGFVGELDLTAVLMEPDSPALGGAPAIVVDDGWRAQVAAAGATLAPHAGGADMFVISATSGSTGRPKFTSMSHWQYYFGVTGMLELMGLSGRHRFLCSMPLYYSGGRNSCVTHLLRGDCVVLYPSLFSPVEYVEAIDRHQITVVGVSPSTVRQLLAIAGETPLLPNLALLFSTGAPLFAEEKRQAARRLSRNFHERYGTAETMAISTLRPTDFADRPDSVGQPHSLAEIDVVDDEDRPLPAGETGRLRFRGPGLGSPLGPAAAANFKDGWYVPGETARLDGVGYIFLQGRTSDVIMRGGAKVYPAEVEAVLSEHAAVAEVAVVGVAGADNEEMVVAFVKRRAAVTAGALLAHCRSRLSPHKAPRRFYFVDQFPRNTAGKIDKLALAASVQRPAS